MTFDLDTLSFPFLFLPAVLLCFTLAPQRCKNGVLVAASLIFYALGDLLFLPLMLCSLLLDYGVCAKLVRSTVQMKGRRLFFWGSIIKSILLMVVSMAGSQLGWFPMPLGLMVYTVTSMGYVIDVYNGDEYFDGNLIDFLLFTTFFGKLQAGPIVQYTELKEQWQHRELGLQRVKTGVKFYVGGLAKLVILAQVNAAVQRLHDRLLAGLQQYSLVRVNSPAHAVPHIVNVSVTGVKGTRFQQALSEQAVCVSVKSACSSDGLPSKAVFAVSRDRRNALSSWRISISHLTTDAEIDGFLQAFDTCYKTLTNKEN